MDIKATHAKLGPKVMGMHVLRGCETVSYPFIKGNISALNTLKSKADAHLGCSRCWVKRMPHI